ncbi:hypothetical protein R1flu_028454 [Riccia fluitans]|uniref:Uncharacterized protein n=1 Tax=Riccia fluitans TaxID=41844 RepID=A0ABD1XPP8_9MARC
MATPGSPGPTSPGYRSYDWRPEGCDGKSKYTDRRDMCFPAEGLVTRSCPTDCIIPAAKPCGPRRPPRCQSPCSAHLDACKCVGKNSRPPFPTRSANPCDYRLCSASETYAEKVSPPHSFACADSCNQQTLHRSPESKCDIEGPARAPDMDAAGIITKNPEYPWPADFHTIIRLDSSVKHQGVYKELGRIKGRPFWARAGDIMIVKMPRAHLRKDNGYVAFYTDTKFQLCPGDLLLRLGKFIPNNVWRYKQRYRLHQLTDEYRWLLIGLVDNFVDLLPLTSHTHRNADIDRHCRWFIPRRGDLIVHLKVEDNASMLAWYNPKTKNCLRKGDILVRAYIGSLTDFAGKVLDEVEAQVEIYMYTGLGLSWIYMGRDVCWLKDGYDIMPSPGNNA